MIRVVIPYGGDDRHRADALNFVGARWMDAGFQVSVGNLHDEPWCKALAVDAALSVIEPDPDDVLVITDADVVVPAIDQAITAVRQGSSRWAMPHRRVVRLTRAATEQLLAGTLGLHQIGPKHHAERPYTAVTGGGCVVMRANLYQQVPLDSRFVGWGQEDEAWGMALTTLAGPVHRAPRDCIHLWHPTPPRRDRAVGSDVGLALRNRYRLARRKPEMMEALLNEFREDPIESE